MLSDDDKKKCSELYKWATGIDHPQNVWNDAAADLLADMYAEICRCSKAMNFVPRPSGGRPGWLWLIRNAFSSIIRNKNKIYEICRQVNGAKYKNHIEIALATR